jgi:DNA ligase D-like protein (predicted ligase)
MNNFLNNLSSVEKNLIQKSPFPDWYNPMLATLTQERFSDPDWIYECKFDGERALTYYNRGKINVFSRNKHNLNKTYPDLVQAFHGISLDSFIIDGEIVAFQNGITNFSALQQRMGMREIAMEIALKSPVYYYIFDILFLNGHDLRELTLKSRKNILKKIISYKDPLRFTEWVSENGIKFYKEACKKNWEGIIAKNGDSAYQGRRSTSWLKFKCHKSQELVIIGYTEPKGHRPGFGALLVGYYQKNKLFYAGKVGTGFTEKTLASLKEKMDKYKISTSPIEEDIRGHITWLKPMLVGEFDFTEWTTAGKLRHPRFKGLRDDKKAQEVVRESSP